MIHPLLQGSGMSQHVQKLVNFSSKRWKIFLSTKNGFRVKGNIIIIHHPQTAYRTKKFLGMPKLWWWIQWNSVTMLVLGNVKNVFKHGLILFPDLLFCCFIATSQCYWGYSNIFTSTLELRQLCVLEVRIRLMMLLSIFLFILFSADCFFVGLGECSKQTWPTS